jgi:hypothetical protein
MKRCSGTATRQCTGTAVGLFRPGPGQASVPMCTACVAALTAAGAEITADTASWRARAIAHELPAGGTARLQVAW